MRRYWYNTKDGKSTGEQLKVIDLTVLAAIAQALGVETKDLIEDWLALAIVLPARNETQQPGLGHEAPNVRQHARASRRSIT